ncbi:FAD-dependent oxidoreductase [Luedemannella flava]
MVDALVIGAGVCGLTTAVVLAEQGVDVVVWAREPERTASWAAGAIWGPIDSRHPEVPRWSAVTRRALLDLEGPEAGIWQLYGLEASRDKVDLPDFLRDETGEIGSVLVPDIERFDGASTGPCLKGFAVAWRYAAPLINMPVYLAFLRQRLVAAGGRLEVRPVGRLQDDLPGRVVVNCSGAGAHDLVPDPSVEAVRGQLVVVENPGIGEFFAEHGGHEVNLTYIFPMNAEQVVLGSTFERHNRCPEPDRDIRQGIIDRCVSIYPQLVAAHVLDEQGRVPVHPRPGAAGARADRRARCDP